MMLLKNSNDILPLAKDKYKSMVVIGINAWSINLLLGNYHGVSGKLITFLEGITEAVGLH